MSVGVICIKIAGILCVVSGCAGIGLSVSRSYRQRYCQLEMLRQMMMLLRGEIRFARSELPEAFAHAAQRVDSPFSEFLNGLAEDMRAMNGQAFAGLWEQHIDKELGTTSLLTEDRDALKRMGSQMGFLDQAMQLAAIDLYLESLNTAILSAGQMMHNKQKVSMSLGILSGFFIAVLLL